jgi:hypothetical protein
VQEGIAPVFLKKLAEECKRIPIVNPNLVRVRSLCAQATASTRG